MILPEEYKRLFHLNLNSYFKKVFEFISSNNQTLTPLKKNTQLISKKAIIWIFTFLQ